MSLDKLTKEQVLNLNLGTGVPIVYEFDSKMTILSKKELGTTKEMKAGK